MWVFTGFFKVGPPQKLRFFGYEPGCPNPGVTCVSSADKCTFTLCCLIVSTKFTSFFRYRLLNIVIIEHKQLSIQYKKSHSHLRFSSVIHFILKWLPFENPSYRHFALLRRYSSSPGLEIDGAYYRDVSTFCQPSVPQQENSLRSS